MNGPAMPGKRAVALALCCLLVIAAVAGVLYPRQITGAVGWSAATVAILWGWAVPVRRYLAVELRLGEQIVVGTVVWVLLVGVLMTFGFASRVPLSVLAAVGMALAFYEIMRGNALRAPLWPRPELTARLALGGGLAIFLAMNLVAMVATRGNPYDDHVAYTAFIKRLLDCGDLVEPFSFRRLSAFGGQTALQALAGLRGDLESIDLLDRGIFQIVGVLVVLDIASRRRLHLAATTIVMCFLLSMWDLDINSGAVWTGFTAFAAAYGFASRGDLSPRASLVLTFASCGLACTLRQNYLLAAVLFPALLLWFHFRARVRATTWPAAWRSERVTVALAVGVAAAVVVPYMIAAWRSSGTPIYPLTLGTFNPSAPMRPNGGTWLDELNVFITVTLYCQPINIWWLLLPLMLLATDSRDRKPWPAMLVACAFSFCFTVHSFQLSDAFDLWRYGYGYMTPLAVIFALEAGASLNGDDDGPRLHMAKLTTYLMIVAISVHFASARSQPVQRFSNVIANVKAATELGSSKPSLDGELYAEMQATVPPGETIAFLLDQPYLLDYGRNRLVNLDLPGFAAPPPGLPSFTDPEHWRAYLTSHGIRYLWFVDGYKSTWLYRRLGWRWRIFDDDELYRFMGAHIVDAIDTMTKLAATSRVLYNKAGVFVIDLGAEVTHETDRGAPEPLRQDRFSRDIAERELRSNVWQLAPRSDVVFVTDENGPSHVVPLPADEDVPTSGIFAWLYAQPLEDAPHRWLTDRSHVRLFGHGRYRLNIKIWIKSKRLFTTPELRATIDGRTIARVTPDADGNVVIQSSVTCDGWCDLYMVMTTMSEWWDAAAELRSFKLLGFEWSAED